MAEANPPEPGAANPPEPGAGINPLSRAKKAKRLKRTERGSRIVHIADTPQPHPQPHKVEQPLDTQDFMKVLKSLYPFFGFSVPEKEDNIIQELNTGLTWNGYPTIAYPIKQNDISRLPECSYVLDERLCEEYLKTLDLSNLSPMEQLLREFVETTVPCEKPVIIIYKAPQEVGNNLSMYDIKFTYNPENPIITINIRNNFIGKSVSFVFPYSEASTLINSILPEGHKTSPGDQNFWRVKELILLVKTHCNAQNKAESRFIRNLAADISDPTRIEENRRLEAINRIMALLYHDPAKYSIKKLIAMLEKSIADVADRLKQKPHSLLLLRTNRILQDYLRSYLSSPNYIPDPKYILKAVVAISKAQENIRITDAELGEEFKDTREESNMLDLLRHCRDFYKHNLNPKSSTTLPDEETPPLEQVSLLLRIIAHEINNRITARQKTTRPTSPTSPANINPYTINPESSFTQALEVANNALALAVHNLQAAQAGSYTRLEELRKQLDDASNHPALTPSTLLNIYTSIYSELFAVPITFPKLNEKVSAAQKKCQDIIEKHVQQQKDACKKLRKDTEKAQEAYTEANEFYNNGPVITKIVSQIKDAYPGMRILEELNALDTKIKAAQDDCNNNETRIYKDTNYIFCSNALIEQTDLVIAQLNNLRPIINFLKFLEEQKQLLADTAVPASVVDVKNTMLNIFSGAMNSVITKFQETNIIPNTIDDVVVKLSEQLREASNTYNATQLYAITKVVNAIISALRSFLGGIKNIFIPGRQDNDNVVSQGIATINKHSFFGTGGLQSLLQNTQLIADNLSNQRVTAAPSA